MRDSISLISTESKAVTPSSNDLMHYLTNFLHAASQLLHLIMQWQHQKESTQVISSACSAAFRNNGQSHQNTSRKCH